MDSVFEKAKARITRAWIESTFGTSGAYWSGRNYKTLNPLRGDHRIGSFSIRDDGVYYEFIDGSKGDVFDLLASINGTTAIAVARELAGEDDNRIGGRMIAATEASHEKAKAKAKAKAPAPDLKPDWKPIPEGIVPTFDRGRPSYLTLYPDDNGTPCYFVARFDFINKEGEKDKLVLPKYWTGNSFYTGIPPGITNRTLLPINDNDLPVLLVEGEKCAQEAFSALNGLMEVTTWHGGSNQGNKINIAPLAGRVVYLWPDADEAGLKVMKKIKSRLNKIGSKAFLIDPGKERPKGWDIADAIADGEDVESIIMAAKADDEEEDADADEITPAYVESQAFAYTDMGNADLMVAMYGDKIRFNIETQQWMVCRGITWIGSDASIITPMVKGVIASREAVGTESAKKWAAQCEGLGRINSMLTLAARHPRMPVHEDSLDPDQMVINCPNGLIDLRTGELMKGSPDMLISKITEVEYKPGSTCPRFLDFVSEIFLGREEIVEYIQRWFGYALSGDMSAQVFSIFYGSGANGKSTLVELISRIMGTYARTAPPETFVQKQAGGIPNDIAALRGARLVLATETEANARLAESRIKSLTGGDRVSARYMRGEFFEFTPSWKIVISTNHRPRVVGGDHGIWRRIVLIPFDFTATTEKMDPLLPRKLWEEREGILSWLVEGAVKFFADGGGRKGLAIPKVLVDETLEYKGEEDIVGRFIADECYRGEEIAKRNLPKFSKVSTLHKYFLIWADEQHEKYAQSMSVQRFGVLLKERGFASERMASGKCVNGLFPIGCLNDEGAPYEHYQGGR